MYRKLIALAGVSMVVLALGLAALVRAQAPANAAGTWQVTTQGPRGRGTLTQTMTIELGGAGKLTGTLNSRLGTQKLVGTVTGDKVEFTTSFTTRKWGTFNRKYTGTVSGDTMKGTVDEWEQTSTEGILGGIGRTLKWTAKREK